VLFTAAGEAGLDLAVRESKLDAVVTGPSSGFDRREVRYS
jgi:hypothetical protein